MDATKSTNQPTEPKPEKRNPPEECFVCGQVKEPIGYQAFTGRAFCSSECWQTYKRREGL